MPQKNVTENEKISFKDVIDIKTKFNLSYKTMKGINKCIRSTTKNRNIFEKDVDKKLRSKPFGRSIFRG